jgi:hypothetical protein
VPRIASPGILQAARYTEIPLAGVEVARPGIYEWRIDGVDTYIGRYTYPSRPRREFGLNVARLLTGIVEGAS